MIFPGDVLIGDEHSLSFFAISASEELSQSDFDLMALVNEASIEKRFGRKPTQKEIHTHFCEAYLTRAGLFFKHEDSVCLNKNDFETARKFPNYEKEDESLSRRHRRVICGVRHQLRKKKSRSFYFADAV